MKTRFSTWVLTIAMATLVVLPQATLATTPIVQSQKKKPKKGKHAMMAKLAGLYQHFTRDGRPTSLFKQLSSDGAYTNFTKIDGVLMITGEGRYTIADASDAHMFQYTEYLEFDPFDVKLVGTSNPMIMKLGNNDAFVITYQMGNMPVPISEVWVPVRRLTPEKLQELKERASRDVNTM